jgi:hypothetical protein
MMVRHTHRQVNPYAYREVYDDEIATRHGHRFAAADRWVGNLPGCRAAKRWLAHGRPGVPTEAPELKRLVGSYTLIANQADSANVINNAIDAATASMNGLIKAVARKRLETVNKVVTRPGISSDQNNVTVGMNDYVVAAPLDGSTTDVKTPSGEIAKIKGCQSTFPAHIREKCALTPFC